MEMAGHLWQALALGRVTAQVEFHPAVFAADFASRKELAAHCQKESARGLAAALSGRRTRPRRASEVEPQAESERDPAKSAKGGRPAGASA
jgi:1-acyl-sn-glycerol-3-phosphate acyltransferase